MILRVLTCTLLPAVWFCPALSAQVQCDIQTIRGTWAYNYRGSLILPDAPQPVPIVMLGVASIDAQGRMTAPGTAIMGGQVLDFEMVNVTLDVKPDCTVTAKWGLKAKGAPAPFPGQGIDRCVIIPQGNEFQCTTIQGVLGKPIYIGIWKRIHAVPTAVAW